MLRVEDAKPGVEVIAIKNKFTHIRPALSIGKIYTIHDHEAFYYGSRGELVRDHCVALEEVRNDRTGFPYAYTLDQFKLRDPFELDKLFNLDNIDADVLKEKYFENC